jgi:hypothetical protein
VDIIILFLSVYHFLSVSIPLFPHFCSHPCVSAPPSISLLSLSTLFLPDPLSLPDPLPPWPSPSLTLSLSTLSTLSLPDPLPLCLLIHYSGAFSCWSDSGRGGKNNRFFDASRFSLERIHFILFYFSIFFHLLQHSFRQRGIILVILKLFNWSSSVCIGQSDLSWHDWDSAYA